MPYQRLFFVVICDMFYYYPKTALGLWLQHISPLLQRPCSMLWELLSDQAAVSPFTENPLCAEPLWTAQGTPKETHSASQSNEALSSGQRCMATPRTATTYQEGRTMPMSVNFIHGGESSVFGSSRMGSRSRSSGCCWSKQSDQRYGRMKYGRTNSHPEYLGAGASLALREDTGEVPLLQIISYGWREIRVLFQQLSLIWLGKAL